MTSSPTSEIQELLTFKAGKNKNGILLSWSLLQARSPGHVAQPAHDLLRHVSASFLLRSTLMQWIFCDQDCLSKQKQTVECPRKTDVCAQTGDQWWFHSETRPAPGKQTFAEYIPLTRKSSDTTHAILRCFLDLDMLRYWFCLRWRHPPEPSASRGGGLTLPKPWIRWANMA